MMRCQVLKTIESCMYDPNPWATPYYNQLYNYISMGLKVGDNFTLHRQRSAITGSRFKDAYHGWHLRSLSKMQQKLIIKYWKPERFKISKNITNHHIKELRIHAQWTIATHKLFQKGKPGQFIWTQPLIASCPSTNKKLPSIAFIEPEVQFIQRCPPRLEKYWEIFDKATIDEFAFYAIDRQCFDEHDFGSEFNKIIVMTDVMIQKNVNEPQMAQKWKDFISQFDTECKSD